MTTDQPLARFVDRHTVVYEREYAHPIERVWEAVTTPEHLDVWMLPECRVERRLGGACGFGWGGPADALPPATVTEWDAPTAVQYTHGDGSFMRFDLTALGAESTELRFTLHFLPSDDTSMDDEVGGDRPGGPDTAWRPGFLAGFHEFVDRLAPYLSGQWTAADARRKLDRTVEVGFDDEDLELQQRYRQHVIDTIPKA